MPCSGSGKKTFQPHLQWVHSLGWSCQHCQTQREDLQENKVHAYLFAIEHVQSVKFIDFAKYNSQCEYITQWKTDCCQV